MSDHFEPEDELTRRLRSLGQFPVDPAAQSRHLTAMAEAAAAPSLMGTLGNRLRVAVALVVGFMLGTTGLASAGALGPLQPIAARAIEAATPLNVPEGHAGTERYKGAECDNSVTYKNRGSYLKAIREKYGKDSQNLIDAKASRCGKPLNADEGEDGADVEGTENEKENKDEKGKSADARANKESKAKGPKTESKEGTGTAGEPQGACANGAADNGVEPADGAAVAGDEQEPADEQQTPTTGQPDCAKKGEGDASTSAENGKANRPTDTGKPAGAATTDTTASTTTTTESTTTTTATDGDGADTSIPLGTPSGS